MESMKMETCHMAEHYRERERRVWGFQQFTELLMLTDVLKATVICDINTKAASVSVAD